MLLSLANLYSNKKLQCSGVALKVEEFGNWGASVPRDDWSGQGVLPWCLNLLGGEFGQLDFHARLSENSGSKSVNEGHAGIPPEVSGVDMDRFHTLSNHSLEIPEGLRWALKITSFLVVVFVRGLHFPGAFAVWLSTPSAQRIFSREIGTEREA